MKRLLAVALLAALVATMRSAAPPEANPRIVIGPNILVSHDGDVAHCETMVAANPTDPRNLLGGSIVMILPDGGPADMPYASFDGGSTWTGIRLPAEFQYGGGDPQVGFGITGTAYFVALSPPHGMLFFRSTDGGVTWSQPLTLSPHNDHEMLATDHTFGPYAGRVYLTAESSLPGSNELETLRMQRRVVLYRSSDDGRSFIGPIEVARGHNTGLAAQDLLVLSDGTLFIPMLEYPNYAVDKTSANWNAVFSTSRDGGVTFSPVRPIGKIYFGGEPVMRENQRSGRVDQMGGPAFAVGRSGKYRDRIYAAWDVLEGGRFRLMLTWSSDRGKTWTTPKPVDPNAPAYASEFQPMIAVNPDGVLGIFWYDTTGYPKRNEFAAYFTASVDGGETLLPKRLVSSDPSTPFGSGNLRPGPIVRTDRGMVVADFLSGISRWVNGGDYIGMTAGRDGTFHPFWADARSGTYQLYTAAIRVPTGPQAAGGTASTARPSLVPATLSDKITLVFDPIQYDRETRLAVIPVRLKNISDEKLYPPFKVEIKEFAYPYAIKSHEKVYPPVILNSSNGKQGIGAIFEYAKALGDLKSLDPGAVTNAIPWKLEAASPVKTNFHLGVTISGFVGAHPSSPSAAGGR